MEKQGSLSGTPNLNNVVIQMSTFVYGNTAFKNRKWFGFLIFCLKGKKRFNRISNTCSISTHSLIEMQFSKMNVVGKSGQNNNS